MSARNYILSLALVILVFVVLIPGGVLAVMYAMERAPGWRSTAIGFGYVAFFLGIPLWILGFGIALWRTVAPRVRSVGLPAWAAFSLLVFVAADWRFFLWLFQPLFAPFLCAGTVLLVALMFLPDRPAPGDGAQPQSRPGFRLAVWALGIEAVLAAASLAGSLAWSFTGAMPLYRLDIHAQRYGYWWALALAAAMAWAIVEGRRAPRAA
jgi:hypothetical protein